MKKWVWTKNTNSWGRILQRTEYPFYSGLAGEERMLINRRCSLLTRGTPRQVWHPRKDFNGEIKDTFQRRPELSWALTEWAEPQRMPVRSRQPHLLSWSLWTGFTELKDNRAVRTQRNVLIWWTSFKSASLDHRREEVMVYSARKILRGMNFLYF